MDCMLASAGECITVQSPKLAPNSICLQTTALPRTGTGTRTRIRISRSRAICYQRKPISISISRKFPICRASAEAAKNLGTKSVLKNAIKGGVVALVAVATIFAGRRFPVVGLQPLLAVALVDNTNDINNTNTQTEEKLPPSSSSEDTEAAAAAEEEDENGNDEDEEIDLPLEEHERAMLNAWKKDPTNVDYLSFMLIVCIRHGDLEKAANVAANLKYVDPAEVRWTLVRAQLLTYLNRLHAAESEYEELLERDPLNIEAIQGLVTVLRKFGDETSALLTVEDALERAKKEQDKVAIYNLRLLMGQVYIMQEDFEKALEYFRQLNKEDKKDFRPYLCQGMVYSQLGQDDKAEQCFEAYKKYVPKDCEHISLLNQMMLLAKKEAQRQDVERKSNEERVTHGKEPQKPMKRPLSEFGGKIQDDSRFEPAAVGSVNTTEDSRT